MRHFGGISSRASSLPSGEGGAESERGSVFTEVDIEMDELKVIQRMVEAEETREKLQRVFGFYTFTKLVPGRAAVDWQIIAVFSHKTLYFDINLCSFVDRKIRKSWSSFIR